MAWGADNYVNGLITINRAKEGEEWQKKAIEHWYVSRPEYRDKDYPATLKRNYALALIYNEKLQAAREVLNQAMRQIADAKPYQWQMAAQ